MGPSLKIFVAEDDPQQRELVRALLQKNTGTEITFFPDGLKLYQKVLAEPPRLIISDILLPSLTGLALTRLLKIQEDFRGIPILIVSAVTEKDVEARVKTAGADAFLPKPIQMHQFTDVVTRLLNTENSKT